MRLKIIRHIHCLCSKPRTAHDRPKDPGERPRRRWCPDPSWAPVPPGRSPTSLGGGSRWQLGSASGFATQEVKEVSWKIMIKIDQTESHLLINNIVTLIWPAIPQQKLVGTNQTRSIIANKVVLLCIAYTLWCPSFKLAGLSAMKKYKHRYQINAKFLWSRTDPKMYRLPTTPGFWWWG